MTTQESSPHADGAPLHFSLDAARKVKDLLPENTLQGYLRIAIQGGGCHGFEYKLDFIDGPEEDDWVIEQRFATEQGEASISLVIDPVSVMYLDGAEVGFRSDLQGEQFVIRNPLAKTTCGCGSSFSLNDTESSAHE